VDEIFAAFDFLMPNFLGTSTSFAKEFANPITKGHVPGASADSISLGVEKLKVLHQQVLPFILRREKDQVLKDLPPKCVSTVPCRMSIVQQKIYSHFLKTEEGRKSVEELQRVLRQSTSATSESRLDDFSVGSSALKTLLYLRLLCTHPFLVGETRNGPKQDQRSCAYDVDMSGKFLALAELLRASGIHRDQVTGADNDSSLLYCSRDADENNDDFGNLIKSIQSDNITLAPDSGNDSGSKCLVFAQFTQSLDAVEELLLKRHMPSLRYLRLDGRVPATKRSALVDSFNNDPSIKLMLLTTRVGSLGLCLTGADTVIFLENDFNPFADLQAADRAHRIGTTKSVNVYHLVTKDTIEEQIIAIGEKKLAMSKAIVNSDNSTMFSMGTDRLLDIFTCRSDSQQNEGAKADQRNIDAGYNLDTLVESYKDEYSVLGMNDFLKGLQNGGGR
jgi:TATA-binding protein-associated factor